MCNASRSNTCLFSSQKLVSLIVMDAFSLSTERRHLITELNIVKNIQFPKKLMTLNAVKINQKNCCETEKQVTLIKTAI